MCGRWLDDCGAPKYFTACSLSHRPAASGGRVLPKNVPNTDNTGLHSQRCTGYVQEGAQGEGFTLGSYRVCGTVRQPHRRPFYELSIASRTFMICCLMTLVASPAFGIKYLSRGRTRRQRRKINITNNKSDTLRQPTVRNFTNRIVLKEWIVALENTI